MINPTLNINKSFREEVTECMNNTFVAITQPHIKTTLEKKKTRVSALLMFYETRKNPRKYFKVLSCVIYTIIRNYVCIDYNRFKVKYRFLLEGVLNAETNAMTKYWELEFQIC